MSARHYDLDLSDEFDRSVFRTRVSGEFSMTKAKFVREAAEKETGKPAKSFRTVNEAIRAIANARIAKATGA